MEQLCLYYDAGDMSLHVINSIELSSLTYTLSTNTIHYSSTLFGLCRQTHSNLNKVSGSCLLTCYIVLQDDVTGETSEGRG